MNVLRYRSAVAPLRRGPQANRRGLPSVVQTVLAQRPDEPMHCLRPRVLAEQAAALTSTFPGDVLYAVKCNPEPAVLNGLWDGGVRHFDAASLTEVRLVRQLLPTAGIHFMHPVKSRPAIRAAYALCGVRDFSLDTATELDKIVEETDGARDLGLVVRLALPKGDAVYDLSGKFGAAPAEAAALLRACRRLGARVGLSFHVGSQCLDPAAYERALALAGEVIAEADIDIDLLDVGGGFPVSYPDEVPPPLDDFMAAIARGVARLGLPAGCRLWCEPGRALVAAAASVVVRVLSKRDGALFVNDGVYGSLSDSGAAVRFRFPMRLIRAGDGSGDGDPRGFVLFGPTCDSADRMTGQYLLPADVREGDWIEIGQLGAYGTALRTGFNGFDQAMLVEVNDRPLLDSTGFAPAVEQAA